MSSALSVILALSLATEPLIERPNPTAVKATAILGGVLLGVGLGFQIAGRVGSDPRMLATELHARSEINQLGGLALMAMGVCLLSLAALLTQWHFPSFGFSPPPEGGLARGARLP